LSPASLIRRERGQSGLESVIDHITESELRSARKDTNSSFVDELNQSERVLYIAKMLPRQFVTAGSEWVLPYSLSNKTFNLVDRHYHQFMVMQRFVWDMSSKNNNNNDTWKDGRARLVHRLASTRQRASMDITADSELAMVAIKHLLTLTSLEGGPGNDMSVRMYYPDAKQTTRAYTWLVSNWKKVQTLSSRNCVLPNNAPGTDRPKLWMGCMRKVVREQLGLGMKKTRSAASSFEFTAGARSVWTILGVDLPAYAKWLMEDQVGTFVTSPDVCVPCDLCDFDGGPVDCVYQGGLARCTDPTSGDSQPHRNMTAPLDTGLQQDFDRRVAAPNVEQEDHHHTVAHGVCPLVAYSGMSRSEEVPTTDNALVDRLLQFMGFLDGVKTKASIGIRDILLAVRSHELPSLEEQACIKLKFQLAFVHIRKWDSARQVTPVLRRLGADAGFKVSSRLLSRNVAHSRSYTIEQ
jgi:hypothetical protein